MKGRPVPDKKQDAATAGLGQRVCIQCGKAPGTLIQVEPGTLLDGPDGYPVIAHGDSWICANGCVQQFAFEAIGDTLDMIRNGVKLSPEDRKSFNRERENVRKINRSQGVRRHQNRGSS